MNRICNYQDLDFESIVKLLDKHYTERYTLSNYYEVYAFACRKFNVQGALLPGREYRKFKQYFFA